tara:strand:+ start:52 stop:675 length:624 start_codon:yes stop_codon:yes gene_type:complete
MLLKLIFNNVKLYGYLNLFNITLFEIIYLIRFRKLDLFYKEKSNHEYKFIRKSRYNSPHLPTPYYFIYLINKILKNKIKKFTLIDFGCGSCRVINYFCYKVKKVIGIDIDQSYKKYRLSNKQIFYSFDIRKKNLKQIIKDNDYILYFFEPFELDLVKKIISNFNNKRLIIILINYNIKEFKNLKKIYSNFWSKTKGIIIFSNFEFKK